VRQVISNNTPGFAGELPEFDSSGSPRDGWRRVTVQVERNKPKPMNGQGLNHAKWECKYHLVFIPKCRRKTLYEELRAHL
jgi:hypothetical protein